MSGDSKNFETLKNLIVKEVVVHVDEVVAGSDVKLLEPRQRKCLYRSEPDSPYFEVNILKIEEESNAKLSVF